MEFVVKAKFNKGDIVKFSISNLPLSRVEEASLIKAMVECGEIDNTNECIPPQKTVIGEVVDATYSQEVGKVVYLVEMLNQERRWLSEKALRK